MPRFTGEPPKIHKADLTGTIRLPECIEGHVYRVAARNFILAIYAGEGAFIGIRDKFGRRYLDTEYHYDTGAPHGTVIVIEDTGLVVKPPITTAEDRFFELLDSIMRKARE